MILCSPDCIDKAIGGDSGALEEIQGVIGGLQDDLHGRDAHIKRLERRSASFLEEATQSEEKMMNEIKERDLIIVTLRKKIEQIKVPSPDVTRVSSAVQTEESERLKAVTKELLFKNKDYIILKESFDELKTANTELHSELSIKINDIDSLKQQVSDLQDIFKNMTSSLRILEADNEALRSELENIHLAENQVHLNENLHTTTNRDSCSSLEPSVHYKSRVLMYGDLSVKNLAQSLHAKIQKNWLMESWFSNKPEAMDEITGNVFSYTKDYANADTVIVGLDLSNEVPSYSQLRELLSVGKTTNLIMLIKCDLRLVSGRKYNSVLDYITRFSRGRGLSIRLINDVRSNKPYRHTLDSMTDLLKLYIEQSERFNVTRSVIITARIQPNELHELTSATGMRTWEKAVEGQPGLDMDIGRTNALSPTYEAIAVESDVHLRDDRFESNFFPAIETSAENSADTEVVVNVAGLPDNSCDTGSSAVDESINGINSCNFLGVESVSL